MMYIAEKADKMFPQELDKKYDVVQWLMWQMAGLGPMQVCAPNPFSTVCLWQYTVISIRGRA